MVESARASAIMPQTVLESRGTKGKLPGKSPFIVSAGAQATAVGRDLRQNRPRCSSQVSGKRGGVHAEAANGSAPFSKCRATPAASFAADLIHMPWMILARSPKNRLERESSWRRQIRKQSRQKSRFLPEDGCRVERAAPRATERAALSSLQQSFFRACRPLPLRRLVLGVFRGDPCW